MGCYSITGNLSTFRQASLTVRRYPFILLREERHCESKVSCPEHNTMTRPGLEPRPLDAESSALTTGLPRLPAAHTHPIIYRIPSPPPWGHGVLSRIKGKVDSDQWCLRPCLKYALRTYLVDTNLIQANLFEANVTYKTNFIRPNQYIRPDI